MKKIKLLALALAVVMCLSAFVACGEKEPEETTPPEPVTFADLLNPSASVAEKVVSKMASLPELDGYTRNTDINGREFALFEKEDTNTGFKTYKVFSLRNGKVVATLTNTADVTYEVVCYSNMPLYSVSKAENVYENSVVIKTRNVYSLYDASGAQIDSKIGSSLSAPDTFYDWVVYDRNVYTVDKATGALSKKTTLPRNVAILDNNAVFNGTNIYVDNTGSIAVFDADFNYICEWFVPVTIDVIDNINWFVLNDGNLLIQYFKILHPDAIDYDIYEGKTTTDIVKLDIVTEIFSITDKTTKNVAFDYVISEAYSNKHLRYMSSFLSNDANVLGEFENFAIIYPIQDRKINSNSNVMDIVLVDNNGVVGKSMKLVENQTYIPTKISENLYRVQTTYGYALTDVEGKVIKQATDSLLQVGEYFVDDDAIYNLNFETVYDFDAKNAVKLGNIDNTIFVKQYSSADKDGDYTVLAFSKGEPKEVCKFVKANTNNNVFSLITNADIYSLYNQETKLYSYYNADGTELMKDTTVCVDNNSIHNFSIAWYQDSSSGTPVVKYVFIADNWNKPIML